MNENFEILKVQINGPLPKRGGGKTGVPGENHRQPVQKSVPQ